MLRFSGQLSCIQCLVHYCKWNYYPEGFHRNVSFSHPVTNTWWIKDRKNIFAFYLNIVASFMRTNDNKWLFNSFEQLHILWVIQVFSSVIHYECSATANVSSVGVVNLINLGDCILCCYALHFFSHLFHFVMDILFWLHIFSSSILVYQLISIDFTG